MFTINDRTLMLLVGSLKAGVATSNLGELSLQILDWGSMKSRGFFSPEGQASDGHNIQQYRAQHAKRKNKLVQRSRPEAYKGKQQVQSKGNVMATQNDEVKNTYPF